MPSSFSHAMAAVAIGSVVAPRGLLRPVLVIGVVCAVLPDVDAIGRPFYGSAGDIDALGGHRGFTHSLSFAVFLAIAVAGLTFCDRRWSGHRLRLAIYLMFATASHGFLDFFTSIGADTSPVQFLSPMSTRGYTASWHPIRGPFSELFACLLPMVVFTRLVWHVRGIPWPRWTAEPTSLRVEEPVDQRPESP